MPPVVIDLQNTDDLRDAVHRAVQALAEGKVIALPTETVYGLAVSALNSAAVERLFEVKQRPVGQPFVLAVKSAADALDYVPQMSPLGKRLARRCWPGPVTLVVEDSHPESLLAQLPERVREAVTLNHTIGLRVPAHPIALDIMRMLAGPLALTSANLHGQPDAIRPEQVLATFGDRVPLVLSDGQSRLGQSSTVVAVRGRELKILREGVVSEQTLRRLSNFLILFVCTGNTCRSPMAETLCRKMVSDRLNCPPETLADHGIMIASAGISATMGGRPSAESVQAMAARGLHLGDHESQPVTEALVRQADVIWTMTGSHRSAIVQRWPEAAARTEVLSHDEQDIADPIGGPLDFYKQCAAQIQAELEFRLARLEF
jgi:protein-tyrosine phosphatase